MTRKFKGKSIFFKPRSKRIARIITIKSVTGFHKAIRELKKNELTLKEFRALKLAQARVKASLKRKDLSPKVRARFKRILKIRIPRSKIRRFPKQRMSAPRLIDIIKRKL